MARSASSGGQRVGRLGQAHDEGSSSLGAQPTSDWNGPAHRLSNARTEAANTRIRLVARRAFGFHTPDALIALAKLTLGGHCLPLPGQ